MSENDNRYQAARAALIVILDSLNRELSAARYPEEFARTLHTINRTSNAGQAFLAALDDGSFLPESVAKTYQVFDAEAKS